MRKHLTSWIAVCCASFCFANAALAQTPSGADKAAAEALFRQARTLSEEGRHPEACPKYEASQQLEPGLGTLLYLADCYEKSGRLASAWATFEEAVSLANTRGDHQRAEIAAVRAAALEPQLIRLVVEVPEPLPEGFELSRNGVAVPAAVFGLPVPVDAGTWRLRAQAPGYQTFETSVSVDHTQKEPYRLRLLPLVPTSSGENTGTDPQTTAPLAASSDDLRDPGSQRTLGLIIGSAGILAGLVSGLFTVLAVNSNDESLNACSSADPNACGPDGVTAREDALRQAGIATGAAIVGVVGVGVGATLFFTAPSRDGERGAVIGVGGQW